VADQEEIRKNQDIVTTHSQHLEAHGECQQLLETLSAKLQLCKEPSLDKPTLYTKLDKVLVCITIILTVFMYSSRPLEANKFQVFPD